MEFADGLNVSRFVIGIVVLMIASVMDIRTRKVMNRVWLISGGLATVLFLLFLAHNETGPISILISLPVIFLYYYFYSEIDYSHIPKGSEWLMAALGLVSLGIYIWSVFHFKVLENSTTLVLLIGASILLFLFNEIILLRQDKSSRFSWIILILLCFITLFYLSQFDPVSYAEGFNFSQGKLDISFLISTSVLMMILIIYSMYNAGIIMGGADAKGLMFISFLFPAYPVVSSWSLDTYFFGQVAEYPFMVYIFPFTLAVLINGALLLFLYPLVFILFNLTRKDLEFPKCLFGYRLEVEKFKDRFVWLLEKETKNGNKMSLKPLEEEEEQKQLDAFTAMDREKVWVQPKIPFLVLLTFGFASAFVLGNIIYILMGLIM